MDLTDERGSLSSTPTHTSVDQLNEDGICESGNCKRIKGPLEIPDDPTSDEISTSTTSTTGTTWVTETTREPETDQPSTTILTSPTTTTSTTTLTPDTETVSGPTVDQTWTTISTSPTTTTSTTTLTPATETSESISTMWVTETTTSERATDPPWTMILTSPTTTTTTTTLTPVTETETVSGPTIDQTWTTVLTSLTTTMDTTTLTPVTTTFEVLGPSVRNDNGLSPGPFDFGLVAFIIVMVLCGFAAISSFIWLAAKLFHSRPIIVRRMVGVDGNGQVRDDFGEERGSFLGKAY